MKIRRIGVGIAVFTAASFLFTLILYSTCPGPGSGCVNQGKDRRLFPSVVCCLQRRLSWNSKKEPHFLLIGNPGRTNLGIAWPPYLVFNTRCSNGRWIMFRIGFRYDRNWHGYIFPTLACKNTDRPLRY